MTTTDQRGPDEFADLDELMSAESAERAPVDLAARHRRRRRGWIVTAIVVAVVLAAIGGYSGWALTAPVDPPAAASDPPPVPSPGAVDFAVPETGAAALSVAGGAEYLGAEAEGIWLSSGSNDPRPLASLTKLITALVVLDAHPLAAADDPGPMITFGKRDHDLYDKYYVMGSTIAAMPTGTRMSLHDAISAMLVPSASNYAEAVSTWAFGSTWGFRSAAQSWLEKHGLAGTTIVEPTGNDPGNLSTPSDLIAIGKLAAAQPAVASIVSKESVSIPGAGAVYNTNAVLGSGGITGLKTGNLGPGTYNLLYSALVEVGLDQPLTVIGVILGGPSREWTNQSALLLLDSLRAGFHNGVPLAAQGDEIGALTTPWGSSAKLVVGEDAAIFTWSDTPIEVELDLKTPKGYIDGEEVGTITWSAGPNTVTAPVVVEGSIRPPDAWWRLTHPAELGG
ncbi:D-alanyl-D-alanine carboxypeptidase family protein [Microbacterium sp. SSM24]|uniref:D-alanyl-D-alanine carboxypeptidase family protein n=1 Tax=Microbacterium sp. SSM24 TaxID=2991714 RepID=UPI0022271662|nr:D-alanyl-D-alanine carboxypeptidase [Microbacterium sp. SSM24]MCW3491943.1 D-alanyl-D-alanine carboxypeptidase [Microbacterium sp. SSM24]